MLSTFRGTRISNLRLFLYLVRINGYNLILMAKKNQKKAIIKIYLDNLTRK